MLQKDVHVIVIQAALVWFGWVDVLFGWMDGWID